MRNHYLIIFIILSLISCDNSRVFEENIDFKNRKWPSDSTVEFSFSSEDTTSQYRLLVNIRNTADYPYQNIYIGYSLKDSLGNTLYSNMEDLKALENYQLFDPKSGEPYGKGLGDLFEHRLILMDTIRFSDPGKKILALQQFMRDDELMGIVSVGYRLELLPVN